MDRDDVGEDWKGLESIQRDCSKRNWEEKEFCGLEKTQNILVWKETLELH